MRRFHLAFGLFVACYCAVAPRAVADENSIWGNSSRRAKAPDAGPVASAGDETAAGDDSSSDVADETPPTEAADGKAPGRGAQAGANAFPPALVASGRAAFSSACTQCHDAERSTSKRKDLAGWRATVRRMAGKSGADVPQSDWEAIATYLTSLSAPAAGNGAAGAAATREEQQLSVYATFSPTFREGNDNLELPGFMPQTWVGAAWTQAKGPLSARATACVTCHIEPGNGHRVELVEAAMRLDVAKWICDRDTNVKVNVDAGRFIVPFGAFSAQVNPGVYRTVSTPLIFNMGQRVQQANIGDPVLPMPYADQGALINGSLPIGERLNATLDTYIVNGLRGNSTGIDFYQSRNYVDNNKEPAVGGRMTFGGQWVRFGSSLTAGRFNDDTGSGPHAQGLYYKIYGIDVTARYKDFARFQFEYAQRDSDRVVALPGLLISRERVGGLYFEGEVRLFKKPRISFLMRYDMLNRDSLRPPPGSILTVGDFSVTRTTYGLNTTLAGGSLLMLNLEHWHLPNPLHDIDVLGIRWAATF
jgi:hypothetical protein